tara:strand:- start:97 stop:297 length:201 start_codon:yes stop_codon:yes gene_type:complete
MGYYQPGDFVKVNAGDTIRVMFQTPNEFNALVIDKMTPDSYHSFYRLLWNGNLIVVPEGKMRLWWY